MHIFSSVLSVNQSHIGGELFEIPVVRALICHVMRNGNAAIARALVYDALDEVRKRTGEHGVELLVRSIDLLRPLVETRSVRVAGSNYQVPFEISEKRQYSLAFRWLVSASRSRTERTMSARLASEIISTVKLQSQSYKKRVELHKMAESNRAFVHFRW